MFDFIKKHKCILLSGICVLAFIFIILTCGFSHNKTHKPSIGIVNVNAIMTNYIQKQAKLNVDGVYLQKATKAFVHQLEKEMKILADKKEIILFVSEAVLSGAKDYTPELEKTVYQALIKGQ